MPGARWRWGSFQKSVRAASSCVEAGGTLINMEGRVQQVVRVENPPEGAVFGFMRPDWRIFADIAKALGSQALNYQSAADVFKEIRGAVPGFPAEADRTPRRIKPLDQPLAAGDSIRVTGDDSRAGATAAVKADPECSPGAVYFTRRVILGGIKQGSEMGPLLGFNQNPTRVRVARVEG